MYTVNFAYVGNRATGNAAGRYLLAGPSWHGETPSGINAVIRCETQFALNSSGLSITAFSISYWLVPPA
jgi:hypothetical protein